MMDFLDQVMTNDSTRFALIRCLLILVPMGIFLVVLYEKNRR